MSTLERRDAMLDAVEGDGFASLRKVVVRLVEEGIDPDILLEDLDQIQGLVDEEHADITMNVMDRLVGWCSDWARILPRPQPGDADFGLRWAPVGHRPRCGRCDRSPLGFHGSGGGVVGKLWTASRGERRPPPVFIEETLQGKMSL